MDPNCRRIWCIRINLKHLLRQNTIFHQLKQQFIKLLGKVEKSSTKPLYLEISSQIEQIRDQANICQTYLQNKNFTHQRDLRIDQGGPIMAQCFNQYRKIMFQDLAHMIFVIWLVQLLQKLIQNREIQVLKKFRFMIKIKGLKLKIKIKDKELLKLPEDPRLTVNKPSLIQNLETQNK